MRPRTSLAHLPTPLWHHRALDEIVGTNVWVKRDDMTAGAAAGNKIRKLEFLLADALARNCTWILTCGGSQSNHARATALCAAELGFKCHLLLRAKNRPHRPFVGNLMLDELAGAKVSFVTPDQYQHREELLEQEKTELSQRGDSAYVIPEGGSNGLGALGYVEAMNEVRTQLDQGVAGDITDFDAVALACGSGGTAAGTALGAARFGVARRVVALAVCDDRTYFDTVIARIVKEAHALQPELVEAAPVSVSDAFIGPGYAETTPAQREFIVRIARCTGLVLDPVYSGKALYGLSRLPDKPARVLFLHTGGLPGLLAQAAAFFA